MKETKLKKQKGITLIALIITIIVMLILVTVSITLAINGDLFNKAGQAVRNTADRTAEENKLSEQGASIIDQYVAETIGDKYGALQGYEDIEKDENNYLTKNAKYTTGTDTAVIPAGFKVSSVPAEQTISTGLVIIDRSGNEFVWIPVANITDMATYQTGNKYGTGAYSGGYYQGKLYDFTDGTPPTSSEKTNYGIGTSSYSEPRLVTINSADYMLKDGTGTNTYIGTSYDTGSSYYSTMLGFTDIETGDGKYQFSEHLLEEYQNMIASVNTYKGFYVGRYETSLNGTTIQSKSGQTPMNSVQWYNMYYYQDSTRYADNPYSESSSVTSGMITGSQWDAMLNFILTNTNDDGTGHTVASHVTATTYGNHTGSLLNTGATTSDKCSNIYDLGGNVMEWTTEAFSGKFRIDRGGYYSDYRSASPASDRNNGSPDGRADYLRFSRHTLH